MSKVKQFEKPFRSLYVHTDVGTILVSEASEIKLVTVNELTGERNELEGTVLKLASKKMEVGSDDVPYPVVIKFSEVEEIEVL